MNKLDRQVRLFLLLDAVIILLCILGVYHINQKTDLPFSVNKKVNFFLIKNTGVRVNNINSGDTLLTVDGMKLNQREEIEIYLDSKLIGDTVLIEYLHKGIISETNVVLTRFYSFAFIIINVISGFFFILCGIFVLVKCPGNKAARIFHWGSLGITMMLLFTWGNYTISPYGLGIALRLIFQFAYTLTPAVFVWFSLVFPVDRSKRFRILISMDFLAGIAIALLNVYYFLKLIPEMSVKEISDYLYVFNINRIFAVLNIASAIGIFGVSYKKATNVVDRKKLKWLLTGFIIGPSIFILLWAVPELFSIQPLIPEISIPILMIAIPITFTIAIVKYHLMDIDLLIRRSVVYSIVIFSLILLYIIIISLISSYILRIDTRIPSVIAAIIIALMFEPVRRRVQTYVDRKFFRVQYNFREALRKFLKNISETNTAQQLAEIVVKDTRELIPVDKIGFFLLKDNRIKVAAHQNFDLLVNRSLMFSKEKLKTDLSYPVANPAKIEPGVAFEAADKDTFHRWGMNLVIPVKSTVNEVLAFIVLGEKKSGHRYTVEDIDLLNNVASAAASTIQRINVQQELIRKSMEAEKLDELNKQKTLFVSTVSHDLKTPLASIKIFTEIMKNDERFPEKEKQYLDIIEGESDRLTRLINNVLGFARIEGGTRKYTFGIVLLNTIVKKTFEFLNYQLKMEGFRIEEQLCSNDRKILADDDAIVEALINVIANSMKFSIKHKVIYISTFQSDKFSCIEIRDRGIGIKQEDLKNIFKPFFRSGISADKKISGTGLGLSILKHVMDAHKGKIEVESIPDEGTAFILKFPVEQDSETNYTNQDLISNSLNE